MYELVFLPIKNLGEAYHDINNDFIASEELKPGHVENLIKINPTEV